ncbi:MAG: hypothetical protein MUF46_01260 [Desulfobacterales bacterium]|nr:hypothetical protein [Desulfobacterales bacterium]
MDHPSKFDQLSTELESRLNDLFREDDPAPPPPPPPKRAPAQPLDELKKTVLSIDWEITPEALAGLQEQIGLLKVTFQRDKVISMFLQILGALGQYIKTSRSYVHPSTFTVLNSVFARLDEIVATPSMPEERKRKLLQVEMAGYQELRDKIMKRRKPIRADSAESPAPAPPATPNVVAVTPEMLAQAMEELKRFIRSELIRFREELRGASRRG